MNKPQEHDTCTSIKYTFHAVINLYCVPESVSDPLYIHRPLLSDKRQLHTHSHYVPSRVPTRRKRLFVTRTLQRSINFDLVWFPLLQVALPTVHP